MLQSHSHTVFQMNFQQRFSGYFLFRNVNFPDTFGEASCVVPTEMAFSTIPFLHLITQCSMSVAKVCVHVTRISSLYFYSNHFDVITQVFEQSKTNKTYQSYDLHYDYQVIILRIIYTCGWKVGPGFLLQVICSCRQVCTEAYPSCDSYVYSP